MGISRTLFLERPIISCLALPCLAFTMCVVLIFISVVCHMVLWLKRLLVLFFVGIAFAYGIGVGLYKWFPYEQVKFLKNEMNFIESFTFTRVASRDDVLSFDANRKVVPCPEPHDRLGVLVSFGQSNSANSAGYRVKNEEVSDVINWYEGQCYEAKSPLLGATGSNGEWMSLTAQALVENGTYDQVIILSLGVGGSPVAAWTRGSDANVRLLKSLREIDKKYNVTDMIWHQGESDLGWKVGVESYMNSFSSLETSIRDVGINAPLFMSIASYCRGGDYPNNITDAQHRIIDDTPNVILGVNTDQLISTGMRLSDDCHFNKKGQMMASEALAEIISNFHK